MLFGVSAVTSGKGMPVTELAREAEARGLESLWFADHSHIPAKRETPWQGGPTLPPSYYEIADPLTCMAAAAAVTSRLRVGAGVALVIERDPIHLAKAVATLDVISNGRVDLGVGGGWNFEEMRNHGTDPSTRWLLLRERVEAMKAIWTSDPAEYHGQLVNFDPIFCGPKPVQKPHPPIHVGGAAPQGYRRALRYGDGWFPMRGRGDDDFAKNLGALKSEAADLGRSLDNFQVSIFNAPLDPAKLEEYARSGAHRALFAIPPGSRDEAMAAFDRISEVTKVFV